MPAPSETTPGRGEESLSRQIDTLERQAEELAAAIKPRITQIRDELVDFLDDQNLRLDTVVEGNRFRNHIGHAFETPEGKKLVVYPASSHVFNEGIKKEPSERVSITLLPTEDSSDVVEQVVIVAEFPELIDIYPFNHPRFPKFDQHPLAVGYYSQKGDVSGSEPIWERLEEWNTDAVGIVGHETGNFLGNVNFTSVTVGDEALYIARHSDHDKRVDPLAKAEAMFADLKRATYLGSITEDTQMIHPTS